MKQLAFFMNPSRLSWKIISRLSDQTFNANHLIFTGYGNSTLVLTTKMPTMVKDNALDSWRGWLEPWQT